MKDCLFCRIINGEKEADFVYKGDDVVAFRDINPKAKTHILIVPKKHVESVQSTGSEEQIKKLIKIAKKIAKNNNISGYKLVFNVGKSAGQMIDHIHLHFLAGENIKLP